MSLRRHAALRVVCAFLLLVAQQGALTHDIWHSAKTASRADLSITGDVKDTKKNRLCEFHAVFGTVLGAVHGIVAALPYLEQAETGLVASTTALPDSPRLAPLSRGPPTLL